MERKKTALSRFFDVIDGVENAVLAVMVVGMIFTILVQIIGRVIGHPFPWTEENLSPYSSCCMRTAPSSAPESTNSISTARPFIRR